jgi:hypothetical protein
MSNIETLEEAAEKWLNKDGFNIYNHYDTRPSFIEGAKWQQEQDKNRYSDEDIIDFIANELVIEKKRIYNEEKVKK